MNAPPEVIEAIRQWVRKAEHDLEAARRIFAVDDGCPYDTVCFHGQQVVEKYLKALLTLLGIQAPRTHDVHSLAARLPVAERLSTPIDELATMNPYAVDVRYADDWREPRRDEALRALEIAEQVRADVRTRLPRESLS